MGTLLKGEESILHLRFLTPEDGTRRLSQHAGKELPQLAVS